MPDEQIVIQLTLEDKTAIENAKAYRAEIERIKSEMRTLAQQGKVSFNDLAKGILMSQKEIAKIGKIPLTVGNILNPKAITTAEKHILDATKELNKEAGKGTSVWGRFGDAINTAIGIGLYRAVHQAIRFFQELVKAGEESALTVYRLGTAIHALQRTGTAVTVAETLKLVRELRKEYGVFSTREIMGGVANMMLLMRSFKTTSDEMRALLEISADMAVVLGKDMNEAAKELALFISSGYGEALQRAGISVNRLMVVQEAWRLGIKKSYMGLTEQERKIAAVSLLMKHQNDLHEDAIELQDDIIGQLRKQRAEVENLTNAIGLGLLPAEAKLLKAKVALYNVGIWVINALIAGFGEFIIWIADAGLAVGVLGHNIKAALTMNWDEIIDFQGFLDAVFNVWDIMDKGIEEAKIKPLDLETLLEQWEDYSGDVQSGAQDASDRLEEISLDLRDRILEIQEDGNQEMIDAEKDFKDEMSDIDEKLLEENADAWEKYYEQLADIQKDYEKAIANAQEKYTKGLADLSKDTQNEIADANRKYHENEEKEERDHLERLKRLQEEFLFDLEDALRERDALQVLRLIRRYNLDVEQENRDFENRLEEQKDQHKQELEEIKRSEAEKRQELYDNLQEELADAREAADEKRVEAEEARQEAIADAIADAEEARQEAIENYNKELEDMKIAFEAKKEELLKEWAETNNITTEEAKLIADVLAQYFGKTGVADTVFEFFKNKMTDVVIQTQQNIGLLESLLGQAMTYAQQIATYSSAGTPGVIANPNPEQHASGGTMLLTRPHLFMAGEVPEKVEITPLSQLSSRKLGGNGRGTGGKGIVEINLSEGLTGKIIDNALEEVSIIISEGT